MERGYLIDAVYTSRLKRAIRSSWIILREMGQIFRPCFKSYRLNERMYGHLEGKSKQETVLEMGEDAVQQFRTGLYARPPAMAPDHPHWHASEAKYMDLDPGVIPLTESLEDTMERTRPLLETRILPDLKAGKTVMVVAHANRCRLCHFLTHPRSPVGNRLFDLCISVFFPPPLSQHTWHRQVPGRPLRGRGDEGRDPERLPADLQVHTQQHAEVGPRTRHAADGGGTVEW